MQDDVLVEDARREAAPLAVASFVLYVLLAVVSRAAGWQLLEVLVWWFWLCLAAPVVALALDLLLGWSARSRRIAVGLLALIVLANVVGLALLVGALVTVQSAQLSAAELLLTAAVIWATNVIVFGLWFWELDSGGPRRRAARGRASPDFRFPQDETPKLAPKSWRPVVWDYVYVSLTNAIAFSPTDAMPLSRRSKLLMGVECLLSMTTVLLVAARAVNVLGA